MRSRDGRSLCAVDSMSQRPDQKRAARSVVLMSVMVGAFAAPLVLVFGYQGELGRMYTVRPVVAVLIALITACVLLARGRFRLAKLALITLAVPFPLLPPRILGW